MITIFTVILVVKLHLTKVLFSKTEARLQKKILKILFKLNRIRNITIQKYFE